MAFVSTNWLFFLLLFFWEGEILLVGVLPSVNTEEGLELANDGVLVL
jgi:hypothetical protein